MSELTDDRPHGRAASTSDAPGAPGMPVECVYVHDLTAGFAFGALDPDEQRRIEHHCLRCPPCAFVVDQARQTATLLSFVAPTIRPPAYVKATLFTRIAHSTRAEPAVTSATTVAAAPPPAVPFRDDAGEQAGAEGQRWSFPRLSRTWEFMRGQGRLSWQAIAIPLATVPLVLALAIVGGFAVTAQSRVSDLRQDLSQARGENDRLRAVVDAMDGFVATEHTRVYELPGSADGSSPGGYGKVIVNPGTTEAMLLVWGLNPTAAGAGYQVLLEGKGGRYVPAGQFHVDASGNGTAVLHLDQPFTDYESVHVMPMGRAQTNSSEFAGTLDTLVAPIDPNVGELLDTNQPKTR